MLWIRFGRQYRRSCNLFSDPQGIGLKISNTLKSSNNVCGSNCRESKVIGTSSSFKSFTAGSNHDGSSFLAINDATLEPTTVKQSCDSSSSQRATFPIAGKASSTEETLEAVHDSYQSPQGLLEKPKVPLFNKLVPVVDDGREARLPCLAQAKYLSIGSVLQKERRSSFSLLHPRVTHQIVPGQEDIPQIKENQEDDVLGLSYYDSKVISTISFFKSFTAGSISDESSLLTSMILPLNQQLLNKGKDSSTEETLEAVHDIYQSPQGLLEKPKVSLVNMLVPVVDDRREAHLLCLPQSKCLGITGVLQKKGRRLFSLLQPRVRTISSRNVSAEDDCANQPFKLEVGDTQELCRRITSEVDVMESKILKFEDRYNKVLRPVFSSRGLIAPNDLRHSSTLFLHRQTFNIMKLNPSYLSSFDITSYEDGVRDDEEWSFFLNHMVEKRIYVIEDMNSSLSTIQTLMYDHGLRSPEDGSDHDFYKGEFDASYDEGSAKFSFIIWRVDKIIYSEVYQNVSCSSPTDAEAFAAFALLSKARDMNILKLLVCSDCEAVCDVLSGKKSIGKHHKHRNLYLMLRSMKRHFDKLVVMWRPRELMLFADDLAKVDLLGKTILVQKDLLVKWSHHLKGLPLFRVERTGDANTIIRNFVDQKVPESFGVNNDDIFFVEVEDQYKLEALLALRKSFVPSKFVVCVAEEKSEWINIELKKLAFMLQMKSRGYISYSDSADECFKDKCLVVVFDPSIPKDAYFHNGAFHVILVSPHERESLAEKKIPELNALTFVYFNGVTFPLNPERKKKKRRMRSRQSRTGRVDHSRGGFVAF